ncbi:hypothetical protein H8959_002061 [Pygathrix nigripes]
MEYHRKPNATENQTPLNAEVSGLAITQRKQSWGICRDSDQKQPELRLCPDLQGGSRALQGSSEPAKARTLPAAAYPTSAPPGGRPSPPACPQGPAHLTAPPCGGDSVRSRARARARGVPAGSPSERPRPACAVCAGGLRLFEQEGGHISPSRPPSPHPPQAFAAATRPFPGWDRSPSQELPHQQPPGPNYRLPLRPLSSLSSAKSPSGIDLALPHRTP